MEQKKSERQREREKLKKNVKHDGFNGIPLSQQWLCVFQ